MPAFTCALKRVRAVTNRQPLVALFCTDCLRPCCPSVPLEEKQRRPLKEALITVIAAWVIGKSIRYFHLDNCSQTKRTRSGGLRVVCGTDCVINPPTPTSSHPLSPPLTPPLDTRFSHQASPTAKGTAVEISTCRRNKPAGLKFGVKCRCRCAHGMLLLWAESLV